MDESWKSDLERWLAPFVNAFRHKTRARMCPAYVAGLIGAGDRKSVQPMAARDGDVGYDQLHHFIASGAWDAAPLEKALLAEADRMVGGDDAWLIVDDTALPKKGEHSVGVAPQYASALGKTANCQSLVSLTLASAQGAVPESPTVQKDVAASQAVLEEFLAADTVVIGAPMYNFTIPSQLKAWIDRIVVAGKTFRYSAAGPEGLAGNKRVVIAISRGGFYGAGTPAAAMEHLETYLRGVFGFMGVTNPEIIIAEGLMVGPEQREKAMQTALRAATDLQAS